MPETYDVVWSGSAERAGVCPGLTGGYAWGSTLKGAELRGSGLGHDLGRESFLSDRVESDEDADPLTAKGTRLNGTPGRRTGKLRGAETPYQQRKQAARLAKMASGWKKGAGA